MARRPAHSRSLRGERLRCVRAPAQTRHGGRVCDRRRRHLLAFSEIAMTRKTSFYYSFLVAAAGERRAITAVWDFCRAVDDAVDLEADPARAEQAAGRWRDEVARIFEDGTPETPQGIAVQPFTKVFPLPRAAVRRARRRRRDGRAPAPLRDVRGSRAVLPPRGVSRRPHLRRDLRLSRSVGARLRARSGRRAAADEHPARRRRGLSPGAPVSAARRSRTLRLHGGRSCGRRSMRRRTV